MSDSLWPHELQHARPPCPLPTHGVHLNSRPLNRWCHPSISSSVVPFSSWPQSLPASESFPMSQLFAWGVQSTGVSALASFFPRKSQDWSPSEWTGWISLQWFLGRVIFHLSFWVILYFSTLPSIVVLRNQLSILISFLCRWCLFALTRLNMVSLLVCGFTPTYLDMYLFY